jgi:hypothetical protein
MLKSECLECRKVYKEVDDGKRKVDITHGFCPVCLKKIRENKKIQKERNKSCSQKKL